MTTTGHKSAQVLVQDDDFTLHAGDALETLRTLPDGSVNCFIELNESYARLAARRLQQLSLFATPNVRPG